MTPRDKGEKKDRIAAEIRRQLGTAAVRRFLHALPAFRAEKDIPDRFRDQLELLDGLENSMAGGARH
ncbi:hypothetical protein FJ945_22135 [Mesorhizobium sp. B2-4-9]|uniref:hypothetical protein n=1 Tax=Mesorhizobium sp. B2-4-9 TaxID=2589940 RepID=UPI00112EA3B8|nr:hypothetical protein [Mesorhizobium sp. B2-4-9]TPL20332.1 hypothetical protein FJ945_22135 [Mesorhizobium sp. B2-4-9]